jgi:hypothetical protein
VRGHTRFSTLLRAGSKRNFAWTVTDATGAVVANAQVTALETGTGSSRTAQTNASGNYTFPNVAPGNYTSTRVDIQLQLGDVTQSVEVTGAPPLLQTDRADTGRKIDTVQTANLPLGTNRNFQNLLNLVPGTTRANFQHSTFLQCRQLAADSGERADAHGQQLSDRRY